MWQQLNLNGGALSGDDPSHPCGSIAKYYFSDTFEVYDNKDGSNIFDDTTRNTLEQSDISHSYDESKFKNIQEDGDTISNWKDKQWLDLSQGTVKVWFQMETDFDFKKLNGKLEDDLKADNKYTILIDSTWDGHEFGAEKSIFITEINFLGGPNPWMGIYFLSAGFFSLVATIAYTIIYCIKRRKE